MIGQRSAPIRRRRKSDPVTPQVAAEVFARSHEVITRRTLRDARVAQPTPCVNGRPTDRRGYVGNGHGYEHRRVFEAFHGPIPAGLIVDHLCHNRACLNPLHMEAVTPAENSRRGMALVTHCSHGHLLDDANTYRNAQGHRFCRRCHSDYQSARTRRLRDQRARDGVSPEVAAEVFARDLRVAGGCVPKFLGAAGPCKGRWGDVIRPDAVEALTLGHVREHSGGQRRSVPRWLFAGCWFHGVQGWELAHTDELRDYLAGVV